MSKIVIRMSEGNTHPVRTKSESRINLADIPAEERASKVIKKATRRNIR